jgi:hypothetical protein
MTHSTLSPSVRNHVLEAVHRVLWQLEPELFDPHHVEHAGELADLDLHIDELIAIVRRSTAVQIEPYLAQILDDICDKCRHQFPSGYCPLRYRNLCVMYRNAPAIIPAVAAALRQVHDEPYRATHEQHRV